MCVLIEHFHGSIFWYAGVLLYSVLPNAIELSKHFQGNYVIQKFAEHGSAYEVSHDQD